VSFRQGLRFTLSYLSVVLIFCCCLGAFLYLSNMVGEPLFRVRLMDGLAVSFFGMEMQFSAEAVGELFHRVKQMLYFLPPYERTMLKAIQLLLGQ